MTTFKATFALIITMICGISFAQQITVDNTISAQNLIENTLIQGCVAVSNITSTVNGSVNGMGSFGYFEQNNSGFPFQNGIVLTTGNANSAGNTTNNETLNEGNASWGTDADLETALGITGTLNATAIEFNFVSISNTLAFNYILASEEYYENFPCSYSDGFAFLIREAGTSDPYVNIALIPGTSIPVNTNTIHNEIYGSCAAENQQFFEGYEVGDTNYNGRTTVLTATAAIQPNVHYQIKLVIADQSDENYDSAVFIQGNSFDSTVDLGQDIATCAGEMLLDADIQNPQASYSWYLNNSLIAGANQASYNASTSGNYRVVIEIPLVDDVCTIEDTVVIALNATQISNPISDFELCDDISSDGVALFDLTTKDTEAIASVSSPGNFIVSYHLTSADAQNNTNAIASPYQNTTNEETIYIRIEETNNGCLAYNDFALIVNPLPIIIDPSPLEVCDDYNADNRTAIDLSVKNDEITNGQANLNVTYHSTEAAAAAGTNPLPIPYTNTNANEQIFVSVQNALTGCITTTTLNITVLDNPEVSLERHFIDACDTDYDGFSNFDLTSIIPSVIEDSSNVTITFYETNEDAISGSNAIAYPANYTNTIASEQIVYIRVESETTSCASIAPIEIYTNMLATETTIGDLEFCDTGNDGVEEIYFSTVQSAIANGIPNVFVNFYSTEEDRNNSSNAINKYTPYQATGASSEYYIRIDSPTCVYDSTIEVLLIPVQEFQSIGNQTVCDLGLSVDLSFFNNLVTNGLEGFNVSYFLTEENAKQNSEALPNSYTNTTNQFTVYARIQSSGNSCYDVTSFQITVLDAPETTSPSNIVICDDDIDGFSTVDLTTVIPQVIANTNQRAVTFHNSLLNANLNTNAITNANAYSAQTENVYIRVENTVTGCYSVESLSIIVNTLPVFTEITAYQACEDDSDGVADFIFSTKDAEVLNGQTLKNVLYFTNQADADNRVNEINKNVAFQNTLNPQQIFVRVENATDNSCYGTSSFAIKVDSNPPYNMPSNWSVCDDTTNDGTEVFDLSIKVEEISEGINDHLDITFYSSLSDAENGTNPLPQNFTNTSSIQTIYVQIDNGSVCKSMTSFTIEVIAAPEVNAIQPIRQCDDALDGTEVFDITIAELAIANVRQDNIEVSYFESFNDAQANANEITNPESYTNISNPQIAYVKVLNTFTGCSVFSPIKLIVDLPPVINDFEVFDTCATATSSFNLNEVNTTLVDTSVNRIISYFSNETDAEANTNALDANYTYLTNNDTIYARVEFNTTQCYSIYPFQLRVNALPIANQPSNLEACDDDFDGVLEFDLTQQNAAILNGQNANNYSVTYYNSIANANEALEALDTDYYAYNNEEIYARVENNATGCYSVTNFVTLVNRKPYVNLPDQVICLNNSPLVVSATTNTETDQYLWSTGETTPQIAITTVGNYSVTVTSENNCATTSYFTVTESASAEIDVVEVLDFSDPNNVTITVTGIGDYLYQLDDDAPQESNVFQNVTLGYHTLTVIDRNGCGRVSREIVVVDAPKFFTPNGDGSNDTWHITGVETLPGTVIHIFDRYGKALKKISCDTQGWDGTYRGSNLPPNDYWYSAQVKRGDTSFEVKGHFALRR
ncbi:MAG: choice-of-anchor L domain-containing protein [Winogradskyella sp.]